MSKKNEVSIVEFSDDIKIKRGFLGSANKPYIIFDDVTYENEGEDEGNAEPFYCALTEKLLCCIARWHEIDGPEVELELMGTGGPRFKIKNLSLLELCLVDENFFTNLCKVIYRRGNDALANYEQEITVDSQQINISELLQCNVLL